jgi:alpha-amylase
MRAICFYFQVHQPFRLRTYRFFDIGVDHHYYDDYANRYILRRVADKCYIPANNVIYNLIKEFGSSFKVSYSISGTALDQFEMYTPDVLESFQRLADTGCVEFLAETYSHSLSALRSKNEFFRQVGEQSAKIERLFGRKPTTFRNTELIYSDGIGEMVAEMGFNTMLTEGAKHVLGWKSPNYLYCNSINPKLKVLLKNFRLSDDIAFRFSQTSWSEWPVTTEKYVNWLNSIDSREECVNLFMDYETFGEHQWPETGIFDFLKALPGRVLSNSPFKFHTPSELSQLLQPVSPIYVPYPISWADEERDLTAWLGNELQDDAFHRLYDLEEKVLRCGDENIQRDWKYLQTSDHFYYMCTKWFSDGDVHKYFNPYNTPYEAFINFMNILSDFLIRINEICPEKKIEIAATPEIAEAPKDVIKEKEIVKTAPKKVAEVIRPVAKKTVSANTKKVSVPTSSKKPSKSVAVKVHSHELKLLESLSRPALKKIFKDYDLKILAMALTGAGDELTDKVRSSIGQASGRKLKTALKRISSPKSKEVKDARRKVEEQIKDYFAALKK